MLYIVRGLPGSGKSTYAAALAKRLRVCHYEADMYFMSSTGEYLFDVKKLGRAHDWCLDHAVWQLGCKNSVVVSNTFTQWKEMEPYLSAAAMEGFDSKIIQMNGLWESIHGVPEETMTKMKNRFVPNKLLPQIPHVEFSEVY